MIIPVWNEEVALARTAPALKVALNDLRAEVIYVLNDTQDASAEIIAGVFGEGARIVTRSQPSKTAALSAGDHAATAFPRIYIDADIGPERDALRYLLAPVREGKADLTAGRLVPLHDPRTSKAARAVAEVWAALPYAREAGFQCCVAVSKKARGSFGDWPEVIADDLFLASHVPPERKLILSSVRTHIPLPATLSAWIGLRARWLRGERGFAQGGEGIHPPSSNRRAVLRLLKDPRNLVAVALYLFVRLAAGWQRNTPRWFRDDTTRMPGPS